MSRTPQWIKHMTSDLPMPAVVNSVFQDGWKMYGKSLTPTTPQADLNDPSSRDE